ncbi:MAG: hypothetical protein IT348_05935 [Candidatus Eisenbacteria bacterium]|nr:hypothetical protein [Candidatus Eisenbacteria bacterium]
MSLTMRRAVAAWLRRLAAWVDVPVAVTPDPVAARVRALVDEADALDAPGPYKKWMVVAARMQKEHPELAASAINLLIELAVAARAGAR